MHLCPSSRSVLLACAVALAPLASLTAAGGTSERRRGRSQSDEALRAASPRPLSAFRVPRPPGLERFVRDERAAVALGKALFWDHALGSQGQACASCHFQAGADPRATNQLSPGLLGGDTTFQRTASGGAGGPGYSLVRADFPLRGDDVVSSQGVTLARFVGLILDPKRGRFVAVEDDAAADPLFALGGRNVRRVEGRNTPTVINAAFNVRSFWDGRANFAFNGVDPFGRRSNLGDPAQGVYELGDDGALRRVQLELPFSSLASQAVGPPTNDFEMSATSRTHPIIGRLLLPRVPLSDQEVHADDSVLAPFRRRDGRGLRLTYEALIERAFEPRWWAHRGEVLVGGRTFRQRELNFSLFLGLAIQLYEATLVSDASPFDAFLAGDDRALGEEEKLGLELFLGEGRCSACHAGPTLSGAALVELRRDADDPTPQLVERMEMARGVAVYDAGFYNIGVRPTREDPGVGGRDPFGAPLSFSQQLADGRLIDRFLRVDPRALDVDPGVPVRRGERTAVRGAFKTPTLRNVELTAPYMHNGGLLTLEQVVAFYGRGGDFARANADDLDPDIAPIPALREPARRAALAAFMRALTDPRVRDEAAPFDHPSIVVPDAGRVPAVGRRGRAAEGLPPIRLFLEGAERAHQ